MSSKRFIMALCITLSMFIIGCCGAPPSAPASSHDKIIEPKAITVDTTPIATIGSVISLDGATKYHCENALKPIDAIALLGPFKTPEAFCAKRQLTECEPEGPTVIYPGENISLQEVQVLKGKTTDDLNVAFIIIKSADQWFATEPLGSPKEIIHHMGPLITEQLTDGQERLVAGIMFENSDASAQITSRSLSVFCSVGASNVPSCVFVPETWSHMDVEKKEIVTTRLQSISCDDGSLVLYGNLSRLPTDNSDKTKPLIGRNGFRFP